MNRDPRDKTIKEGQIFVFGSNRAGIHGAGAARQAFEEYGAISGQGEGLQGKSYALPTKDENIDTLPFEEVKDHVKKFIKFAKDNPSLKFFVTRVGCGLAGFTDDAMGPLFAGAPDNCELPIGWGFGTYGTVTGRVSAKEPNLSNAPRGSK